MDRIPVLASKKYDVCIGTGLLREADRYLSEFSGIARGVIVSDENVFGLYGEQLIRSLQKLGCAVDSFVFAPGEKSKNIQTYAALLEFMCEKHVSRNDVIFALGGGVVGDLAGFAAATYQRGIRFVQIPTSLLAAVDSSVGGKTAIDLSGGKNQAGAFYQPSLVICDTDVFDTLPEEEYRCGCAEIIKYAVLEDRAFFEKIRKIPVKEQYREVVGECVRAKSRYVKEDEFDTGRRMLLNLGHTFGHAAEACSNFSILHGQGVAMGMAAIARAACQKKICGEDTRDEIIDLLQRYGLPTEIPYSAEEMLPYSLSDKKIAGKTINLIVPEEIGKCRIEKIERGEIPDWLSCAGISLR